MHTKTLASISLFTAAGQHGHRTHFPLIAQQMSHTGDFLLTLATYFIQLLIHPNVGYPYRIYLSRHSFQIILLD